MSATNIELKKKIMRRVYVVAFARKFLRPIVIKSMLLVLFVVASFLLISVPNVMSNIFSRQSAVDAIGYTFHLVAQTELIVQIVLSGIIVLFIGVMLDIIKQFHVIDRRKNFA